MNNIFISGYATEPTIRYTQGENPRTCANFSIAVSTGKKDENGRNISDFFRVSAFDKTGDYVKDHVKKGTYVTVSGRLQRNDYKKDNENREVVQIVATQVIAPLPPKDEAAAPTPATTAQPKTQQKAAAQPKAAAKTAAAKKTEADNFMDGFVGVEDDDFPFGPY